MREVKTVNGSDSFKAPLAVFYAIAVSRSLAHYSQCLAYTWHEEVI